MIKHVLNWPIGVGKTSKIVELVREYNGIMIVLNEKVAKQIRQRFSLTNKQVIGYQSLKTNRHILGDRPVFIDNADYILANTAISTMKSTGG